MSFSQNDPEAFCFTLEWFDDRANDVKTFTLNYYHGSDPHLELISANGSKFLSKQPCGTGVAIQVTKEDLYIGSCLNILGRNCQIVAYANEYTGRTFDTQRGRTVGVVTPAGYNQMGEILIEAQKAGLIVSQMKMVKLSRAQASDFSDMSGADTRTWSQDAVLAVELVDDSENNCADTWEKVCDKLNRKYEGALRTDVVYASTAKNAVQDGKFFFNSETGQTAVFDNCTLAVIRPEAVRQGKAGYIIDSILEKGYEISAVQQLSLTSDTCEKVFGAYRGVIHEYQDMLTNMCSGKCVALCIRGENAVSSFREFCGPIDVEIAKKLRKDTLRARYGTSPGSAHNAIHCTDLPEDGELECRYFFQLMQGL